MSDISLHFAVRENNLPKIKHLLQLGADVNVRDCENKNWTALHVAAGVHNVDSHYALMEILLNHGADVNAQDIQGISPLHIAAGVSPVETVELLLNFGADVNIKNAIDETPLCFALTNGFIETVELLVDRGADVMLINSYKESSLHYVLQGVNRDAPDKIKFLLKKGLDIEARDYENCTLFHKFIIFCCDSEYLLSFFFKYANFNNINVEKHNDLFKFMYVVGRSEKLWTTVLKYLAKHQVLDLHVNPIVLESISKHNKLKDYFTKCKEELEVAESTKLQGCWVTYFNLLVDNKRKLKNYSGNGDLIKYFYESDCLNKFPIYGTEMTKNVEKGKKRRKLFDDSTVELSNCLPIFNPTHLVITDILDCLSFKDCNKFSITVQNDPISNQEITYSQKRKIS